MPDILGYKIRPAHYELLKLLYSFRGGTTKQFAKAIYGFNDIKKLKLVDQYIRHLREQNLITTLSLRRGKERGNFYYLTPEGLELTMLLLDIPEGKVGKGFKNDYGDFVHELYKPPSRQIRHHAFIVDALVEAYLLQKETDEHTFDYRNNLFSARKFQEEVIEGTKQFNKTFMLRPDSEVKVLSNICSVELDMSTERGSHLSEKFERYKHYIDHVKKNGGTIPFKHIVFISEADTSARRWRNLSETFIETMSEETLNINLSYTSIMNFRDLLLGFKHEEEKFHHVLAQVETHLSSIGFKGTRIGTIKNSPFFNNQNIYISIHNGAQHDTLIHILYMEGNQTKGWEMHKRLREYVKNSDRATFTKVKEIIPLVLYRKVLCNVPPFLQLDEKVLRFNLQKHTFENERGEIITRYF